MLQVKTIRPTAFTSDLQVWNCTGFMITEWAVEQEEAAGDYLWEGELEPHLWEPPKVLFTWFPTTWNPSTCASTFPCGSLTSDLPWTGSLLTPLLPFRLLSIQESPRDSAMYWLLGCTLGCPICIIHFLKSFGISCQLNFTSSFTESNCAALPTFSIPPNEGNGPFYWGNLLAEL